MKKLVCIVCPKGCSLTVQRKESGQWEVTGNLCKRGETYAIQEASCPMRTLTTSVWVDQGDYKLVSVKTDRGIPKKMIDELLQKIETLRITAPISVGQILLKNVDGNGANLVATRKVQRR